MITRKASDGTIHTFPDQASEDSIRYAMLAYENRDSWGPGLVGQIGKAIGQKILDASHMAGPHNIGFEAQKLARAAAISLEEFNKWGPISKGVGRGPAVDNEYDAQRHAEWTYRLAKELGPLHAKLITDAWETLGSRGDSSQAHAMDRYNNAVALQAAREGRPYTLDNLQLAPDRPPKTPWVARPR